MLIATPSLLLSELTSQANDLIVLMAILGGLLTFIEYNTNYPSFVEFRDAPPLNRVRFVALFAIVFCMAVMWKNAYQPTTLTLMMASFSSFAADILGFRYSPVELMLLVLPNDTPLGEVEMLRRSASLAYGISLFSMATFGLILRFSRWPTGSGAFNVWVNLPLFDPTAGGDVVHRLQRDGRANVMLGALMPFLIPAILMVVSELVTPISFGTPQGTIWTLAAWAFLPASMVMRGAAMLRVSELIEEKRRRAYRNAEAIQTA